jgi:hypothetical protein
MVLCKLKTIPYDDRLLWTWSIETPYDKPNCWFSTYLRHDMQHVHLDIPYQSQSLVSQACRIVCVAKGAPYILL